MADNEAEIVASASAGTGGRVLIMRDKGIGVPFPINVSSLPDADIPFDVDLTLGADERGRIVCERFEARRRPDGPPVTNERLRDVPIQRWTRKAVGIVAMRLAENDDGDLVLRSSSEQPAPGPKESAPAWRGKTRVSPPSTAVTDETLREVARVYRNAKRAPTNAVYEHFPISRSTAGRHVQMARERGFLKPAPARGKSGEA